MLVSDNGFLALEIPIFYLATYNYEYIFTVLQRSVLEISRFQDLFVRHLSVHEASHYDQIQSGLKTGNQSF